MQTTKNAHKFVEQVATMSMIIFASEYDMHWLRSGAHHRFRYSQQQSHRGESKTKRKVNWSICIDSIFKDKHKRHTSSMTWHSIIHFTSSNGWGERWSAHAHTLGNGRVNNSNGIADESSEALKLHDFYEIYYVHFVYNLLLHHGRIIWLLLLCSCCRLWFEYYIRYWCLFQFN